MPRAHAWCLHHPSQMEVKNNETFFDILKKDSKGTFHWLETANDIETAKARVLKLSSESQDEFVVFRGIDLQVVATFPAKQTDTEVLSELPEQRLGSFAN